MKGNKYTKLVEELDNELALLKIQEIDIVNYTAKAFGLCKMAILSLKKVVVDTGFNNSEEEINFFKNLKPEIFSKFIFYSEIHRIETHRPRANRKYKIKYLKREFLQLQQFLSKHYEFCQYYRGGQTCLDNIYFLRNEETIIVGPKNYGHILDPNFSTSHDELVAHIIAYGKLEKYIDNEILKLKRRPKFWQKNKMKKNNSDVTWTAPKAALVELIYAMHSSNCINNGRIDVKELITLFEGVFNIELDSSYRIFIDIKRRQKEKAKFLEELKKALLRRLDDLDKL